MKGEDLLRAMSEIEDGLILESARKKRSPWKPILAMAACLVLLLGIVGIGLSFFPGQGTLQVALLYSDSPDNGQSYRQAALEALSALYGDRELQYNYYDNAEAANRAAQVENAVESGCDLVLVDGRQERQVLLASAQAHPQVTFMALGISPEELQQEQLPQNVICIDYRPEIAGYLAGYTAVREGYTRLGYYFDPGQPTYEAYGSGYLQGIEAAARELGVSEQIEVIYSAALLPTGPDFTVQEDQQRLEGWYGDGTQLVLACGAQSCEAAEEAARSKRGDVILVGAAQTAEEAEQALHDGLSQILEAILNEDAGPSSAGLMPYYTLNDPDGTWGFRNISEEEFARVRDQLINGKRPCTADTRDPSYYSIEVHFLEEGTP